MLVIWLGALLVIAGVLYLAAQAIWYGRMSDVAPSRPGSVGTTLEPPRRGVRFLGIGSNWPGILLMAAGAVLLLTGGFF